jgi:hypothetical protein
MALNRLGDENLIHKRPPPPVTLPRINLPELDTKAIEAEAREAQARVRVIRAGRDAWEAVAKAQSFEGWKAIGAALVIGKAHASASPEPIGHGAATTLAPSTIGSRPTASPPCRHQRGAWPWSCTRTPRPSPLGGAHCRSASASGSFTRYRSKTLASLYSARQWQEPAGPTAGRQGSLGAFLCLYDGIAGG